jgi:hypothetical protein
MSNNKRTDKNKKVAKYREINEPFDTPNGNTNGKSILLLVEGETEEVYFDKLRSNQWLANSLSGVIIIKTDNFSKALEITKNKYKNYPEISIVTDNDKRNAFVLIERELPFWKQQNIDLSDEIKAQLHNAFDDEKHRYFLSIYDYLQWLNQAIGAENVIEFWDKINFLTPIKNREFADYKNGIFLENKKIPLAYSCISFEFWLILHFQKNKTPFIWVEKGKNENIDVFTFLQTICPNYKKGGATKSCNAYTCLYEDYTKRHQTLEDDWLIIYRIVQACKNVKWLRDEMQPILERQCGKWFEVNPYVLGFDTLMANLLNLKSCNVQFEYFELDLKFTFIAPNKVEIFIRTQDSIVINQNHKNCFMVKSKSKDFLPTFENCSFPNDNPVLTLTYEITNTDIGETLVLIFKDPRQRSRSTQLMVLL